MIWANDSDPKISLIKRRLQAAARTKNDRQISKALETMTDRYGQEATAEAWALLLAQPEFEWLHERTWGLLGEDDRQNICNAGMDVLADVLIEAGLQIEHHLRVADQGVMISKRAVAVLAATGYPRIADFGEGSTMAQIAAAGLGRSPFFHPLSEIHRKRSHGLDDEMLNIWATASVLISAAMGWLPGEPKSEKAKANLYDLLVRATPTLDRDLLLKRARYDDRTLLQLCNYVQQGLQASIR